MNSRELNVLNSSIGLIDSLNLGKNPNLKDIKNALKQMNTEKDIEKANFKKQFDKLIGKTFLHIEDKTMGEMYDIFEVKSINRFEELSSENGYQKGCRLNIVYKTRFIFGSFATHKNKKIENEVFSVDEIKKFKEINDNDLQEFIHFHNIQLENTKNFLKKIKKLK